MLAWLLRRHWDHRRFGVADVLNFGMTCHAAHDLISTGVTAQQLWNGFMLLAEEFLQLPQFVVRNSTGLWALSFSEADQLLPLMPSLHYLHIGRLWDHRYSPVFPDDIEAILERVMRQVCELQSLEILEIEETDMAPRSLGPGTFPEQFTFSSAMRKLFIDSAFPDLFIRLVSDPGIHIDFSQLISLQLELKDYSEDVRLVSFPNLQELILEQRCLPLPNFKECCPRLQLLRVDSFLPNLDVDEVFTGFGDLPDTLTQFEWGLWNMTGSCSSSVLESVASCPHLEFLVIQLGDIPLAARDQVLQALLVFHIPISLSLSKLMRTMLNVFTRIG